MRTLVFVYGSLMGGFHNHDLLRGSIFMGAATLPGKFQMISCGGFPMVVHDEDGGPVKGELWSVPNSTIPRLDRLEGHPHFYKRDTYPVVTENQESHLAWAYIGQSERQIEGDPRIVPNNDWAAFAPHLKESTREELVHA